MGFGASEVRCEPEKDAGQCEAARLCRVRVRAKVGVRVRVRVRVGAGAARVRAPSTRSCPRGCAA